ncbi:ADP-ribosylglycohydrolase [Periconia macrospinosa]|uniref:ADP-ribosylhydrolase ARH3 n=1 Tax=Periconia macrospinosa TaxID=97972 RepID=A0A2V1EDY6_9PLEO|nr:ADP-ribosylglycohydrolase [Periconia macrospinosa]
MSSPLPPDYLHKIYAGVLGKLIGVYLGRPFENWTYQDIASKLGSIKYYVHEQFNTPLVVIDDDVSGTFAFVRALHEHGANPDITSAEIGQTWLNQVIEKRTVFWWGGNGISTEHTVFNNLKHKGIVPPATGSIKTNGKTLAEQIGAQIFIDAWAMVAPGNPDLAAKLARAAAQVSHDGLAVDAAVLWAVMEAVAFTSRDVEVLLDTGLRYVPQDSELRPLVADVRAWAKEDADWKVTRQKIEDKYGYQHYGGICHMIPNHGIMILALLYGGHSFSLAMHIINTCGWDTDCNSGNVGCLVAIMHGLEAFESDGGDGERLDWRGPLADRALISAADGGYSINDAVRITYDLADLACRLVGEKPLPPPAGGAQWHFSLPGSVQGFRATQGKDLVTVRQGVAEDGESALGIHLTLLTKDNTSSSSSLPIEVLTQTFTPADALAVKRDYEMMASPLVFPSQTLEAKVSSASETFGETTVVLRLKAYDYNDKLITIDGPSVLLFPGVTKQIEWKVPINLQNQPIAFLGLAVTSPPSPSSNGSGSGSGSGTIWLHNLKISGTPSTTFVRPPHRSGPGLESIGSSMWRNSWVDSVDKVQNFGPSFHLAQDAGEGLFYTGTSVWKDYTVVAQDFMVNLGREAGHHGVAVRIQGISRFYAGVVFRGDEEGSTQGGEGEGRFGILKARDGKRSLHASVPFDWETDVRYTIAVDVQGSVIRARLGHVEITWEDDDNYPYSYQSGAAGLLLSEGSISAESLSIMTCVSSGL